MNRRDFLQVAGSAAGSAVGAAAVLVTAKAIQSAAAEACPSITADVRVNSAIADLVAALKAVHPNAHIGVTQHLPHVGHLSFALTAVDWRDEPGPQQVPQRVPF